MKVKGLDGRTHSWNFKKSGAKSQCSQYHARCRELLKKLYPLEQTLEEIHLPGSGKLKADFYLPAKRLMVEVHGKQHYEFTHHFHRNTPGFLNALTRDNRKREWAELNGLVFCELPYNEPDERWRERLLEAQE